jgi:predicted secreted Zn-dependent protease
MKTMTDTPAESAEALRTPEELAKAALGRSLSWRYPRVVERVAAALAARDAEWRNAVHAFDGGCGILSAAPDHSCEYCAPLRALLSEGPGQ